jgi:predicted O-linked N-acetylglucosamine transferase (SPINDLY family)
MDEGSYLGLLAAADVVLDTPHYGGGANTCLDAAAAGTPTVTMPGAFHRGRWALAVASALDVMDGVATTPESYVERALSIGTDRAYRATVSARIQAAAPVLFDRPEPAHELAAWFNQALAAGR